jgi:hypothetical protein
MLTAKSASEGAGFGVPVEEEGDSMRPRERKERLDTYNRWMEVIVERGVSPGATRLTDAAALPWELRGEWRVWK